MSEVSRILKYALVGGIIGIVVESILASLTFVCSSKLGEYGPLGCYLILMLPGNLLVGLLEPILISFGHVDENTLIVVSAAIINVMVIIIISIIIAWIANSKMGREQSRVQSGVYVR